PIDDNALLATMWELVWAGRLTGDTLAPVRMLLAGGKTAHKSRRGGPRSGRTTRFSRPSVGLGGVGGPAPPNRPRMPSRAGPATASGRWSLLPAVETDPTIRGLATAEQLLDRYGVLTRGSVVAEGIVGGFAGVYRVLAGAEEAGRVRRGYFVEHLGAAQFGTTGAVDRMRALSESSASTSTPRSSTSGASAATERDHTAPRRAVVLAATDPASPFGASVPWPDRGPEEGATDDSAQTQHRAGRKAGALVALVDGRLGLYLERGGRTALTYTDDPGQLSLIAHALKAQVTHRSVASLIVKKIDGHPALSSTHPFAAALVEAGFHTAPQGLRMRR
ncbi:MAG: DEAD/DEAH box helicase, partial [Ornithinimicrobium sp.]